MLARARGLSLLNGGILAAAAVLGILTVIQPLIALGTAVAVVFTYVVFGDLAIGFAALAFLSFLEILHSGSLSPAKAAGLILALAWIARYSTSERGERHFFSEQWHLTWIMIAFLGWATLTLVWAHQTGEGLSALSRAVPNVLLLPIAYAAVRRERDVKVVVGAIVLGAVVAAVFGVIRPPNPGVIGDNTRATGTVGDPNELAADLVVGLALGAALALARGCPPWLRLCGAISVPLCALGIFLSVSRGGLIALAAMLVAGTFAAGRWRPSIAVLLVALAAGGFMYFTQFAPLPARERVLTANGGSGRADLWKVGMRVARAHPIGGVGIGNFAHASPEYVLQPGALRQEDLIFAADPKVAHNTYLQVLAEMGIPGLALFLAGLAICMSCALRAARLWAKRRDVTMEVLARGVFLALTGTLVANFFLSVEWSKLLWTLLALGPALLAIARQQGEAALK